MPRVFVSYSRTDEPFARRLATSLSQMGADIWIDVEDIPAGMKWSSAIQQGLDMGDLLLVIISPDSMASRNVEDEWQYYLDNSKPVLPVLLRPTKIHFQLNRIQYIDFHGQPYDAALYQLYAELRRQGLYLNPPSSDPAAAYRPAPHQMSPPAPRPKLGRRPLIAGVVGLAVIGMIAVALVLLANTNQTPAATPTATRRVEVAAAVTNTLPAAVLPTILSPPTNAPTLPPTTAPQRPGLDAAVSRNGDWMPITREFNGVGMALAPVGCFTLGSSEAQIETALTLCRAALGDSCSRAQFEDERPQTQICFQQPFWIGRAEISNGQYGSSGVFPGETLPRTNVTWEQAQAFCASRGMRLPTEAEWEYAARGPDGLVFPWGNTFDGARANFCDSSCEFNWRDSYQTDGYARVAPVDALPGGVSWVGALNLSGNVWEWTSTIYAYPYPYAAGDGRENPGDAAAKRVLRGGSWNWIGADGTTTARDDHAANYASSDWYGFRCARDFQAGDL